MSMYTWGLTTSAKSGHGQAETARRLAERYRVPFVHRGQSSLRELQAAHNLDYLVTVDRNGRIFMEEPLLHWHPSMAIPRFRRLMEGGEDVFLTAASLEEGDRVLDCTLGLGADALLAAWAVGEAGAVTGLEASPAIALITEWGLKHEAPKLDRRKAPMKAVSGRITVLQEEAHAYLATQAENSWDVIYFDPMFKAPNEKSNGVNSLRPLASYEPFGVETLTEALRACRKRVVLKERWFSPLFQELGASRTMKTKYGPVAYGLWEKAAR